jgi:hypothetical protein
LIRRASGIFARLRHLTFIQACISIGAEAPSGWLKPASAACPAPRRLSRRHPRGGVGYRRAHELEAAAARVGLGREPADRAALRLAAPELPGRDVFSKFNIPY